MYCAFAQNQDFRNRKVVYGMPSRQGPKMPYQGTAAAGGAWRNRHRARDCVLWARANLPIPVVPARSQLYRPGGTSYLALLALAANRLDPSDPQVPLNAAFAMRCDTFRPCRHGPRLRGSWYGQERAVLKPSNKETPMPDRVLIVGAGPTGLIRKLDLRCRPRRARRTFSAGSRFAGTAAGVVGL